MRLAEEFETLFATVTGYQALDEPDCQDACQAALPADGASAPEIPLHNNRPNWSACPGAQTRCSLGRAPEGARAWDTFMTLAANPTKLGVSFYHYYSGSHLRTLSDAVSRRLIGERAKMLNLGASWDTS